MGRVNFYLREPNSKGETAIIMFFSYKGNRLKHYTGLSIKPGSWNRQKQFAKQDVSINNALGAFKLTINTIYHGLVARKEQVTNNILRISLEREFKQSPTDVVQNAQITLIGLIGEYSKSKKEQRTRGTMLKFSALETHIIDYEIENGTVFISGIDHKFNDRFQNLLFSKQLQKNTVGKLIIGLKVILNWAIEAGYIIPVHYKRFTIPRAPTSIISLTELELFRIYNLKGLNSDLVLTKDLFCLSAFTGQRFSDITRIVPGMINNNTWAITDKKTKKSRIVPLVPEAIEILKRHNFNLHGVKSNQKANTGIKELAKRANIDQPITVTKYYGNKQVDTTLPKNALLTFHTAKKTYVSNFLRNGGRLEVLIQVVGNTEKTLKPYIDISNEERSAVNDSVFKKMRLKVKKSNQENEKEKANKKGGKKAK